MCPARGQPLSSDIVLALGLTRKTLASMRASQRQPAGHHSLPGAQTLLMCAGLTQREGTGVMSDEKGWRGTEAKRIRAWGELLELRVHECVSVCEPVFVYECVCM